MQVSRLIEDVEQIARSGRHTPMTAVWEDLLMSRLLLLNDLLLILL